MINGQDQLAVDLREQDRRDLEGDPGRSRLAPSAVEERGPARSRMGTVLFFGQSGRPEQSSLGDVIDWNVSGHVRPEISRPDYMFDYAFRLRRKPIGLVEGFKNVGERWALDDTNMARLLHLEEEIDLSRLILSGHVPPITGDIKDRMALVIGISIGLGELFNDDEVAERQWLNSARSEFGGLSPLRHMLEGDLLNIRDAVDLLDGARGLR